MTTPLCSRCHRNPRRVTASGGVQRWCAPCHAAYQRDWRAQHEQTDDERRRDICRSYAGVYRRRGKLVAPDACEWCHEPGDLHMHHPDYDRPLLVHWLHPECHADVHARGVVLDRTAALVAELRASTRAPRRTRSQIRAAERATVSA